MGSLIRGSSKDLIRSMHAVLDDIDIDCEPAGKIALSAFRGIVKNLGKRNPITTSQLKIVDMVFSIVFTIISKMSLDYSSHFYELIEIAESRMSEGDYLKLCYALKETNQMMTCIKHSKDYRLTFTDNNSTFILILKDKESSSASEA